MAEQNRPVLATIVGGAWVLMGAFGVFRAVILMFGLAGTAAAFEPGNRYGELAQTHPDFVDEAWHDQQGLRLEARRLDRTLAPVLFVAALAAGFGGHALLRRRRGARFLIITGGLLSVGLSALYFWRTTQLQLQVPDAGLLAPEQAAAFWTIAGVNILLQALPVLVGIGLLQFADVREWIAGRAVK